LSRINFIIRFFSKSFWWKAKVLKSSLYFLLFSPVIAFLSAMDYSVCWIRSALGLLVTLVLCRM
jgi:hypothetical protein